MGDGGWVGWTVELKLNRKKGKNWIPTGGLRPPNSPPHPIRHCIDPLDRSS